MDLERVPLSGSRLEWWLGEAQGSLFVIYRGQRSGVYAAWSSVLDAVATRRCLGGKHCCRAGALQVSGALALMQWWGQKAQLQQCGKCRETAPACRCCCHFTGRAARKTAKARGEGRVSEGGRCSVGLCSRFLYFHCSSCISFQ